MLNISCLIGIKVTIERPFRSLVLLIYLVFFPICNSPQLLSFQPLFIVSYDFKIEVPIFIPCRNFCVNFYTHPITYLSRVRNVLNTHGSYT